MSIITLKVNGLNNSFKRQLIILDFFKDPVTGDISSKDRIKLKVEDKKRCVTQRATIRKLRWLY